MTEKKDIFYQNYESDFCLPFQFENGLPSYPWRLEFRTKGTPVKGDYIVSFDGKKYTRCKPMEGQSDSLMVEFNDHKLGCGMLTYKLRKIVPDPFFSDGKRDTTLPITLNIELCDKPTNGETPPSAIIALERMLKGDPGHSPVLAADVVGNVYSDGVLLSDAIPQAIGVLSEAEQTRIASEQTRETSEEGRVGAELIRAESERQRISDESSRKQAESVRLTAESERVSAETKRGTDTASAIKSAKEAAQSASDQSTRAKALADHPPKIVDVDGLKYWAFWDEVSKDYVTSEYRAEGGAIMPLFWVDPETLMLYVTYQNGYEGAKFKLDNGILYSVKTIEDGRSN